MSSVVTSTIECDDCGDEPPFDPIEADGPRLKLAREAAARHGWHLERIAQRIYVDLCPTCARNNTTTTTEGQNHP